jgi:hypothetical protein
MAAELVVRYMDISGFERVDAAMYRGLRHRTALVEDACARLNTVSPALSLVVRGCSAIKARRRMGSDAALRELEGIDGRSALMDQFVLRDGLLEVGVEIARGSFGAVYKATLYGARVCAKVRRGGLPCGSAPSLCCCVFGAECTLSLAVCCV